MKTLSKKTSGVIMLFLLLAVTSCKKDYQQEYLQNSRNGLGLVMPGTITIYTLPVRIASNIATVVTGTYTKPAGTPSEFGNLATKTTYTTTSSVVGYLIRSSVNPNKYLVVYEYMAKGLLQKIPAILTVTSNTFTESSLTGLLYYKGNYSVSNGDIIITNFDTYNEMPWIDDPTSPVPYQTFWGCMKMHWANCKSSSGCELACVMSGGECFAGMSIACSGRLVCPACYGNFSHVPKPKNMTDTTMVWAGDSSFHPITVPHIVSNIP